MDFAMVALALSDAGWIVLAFVLGMLARLVSLPPLVGFLLTGFVLNYVGISSGETLEKLADLGITLLLFTMGLNLNLKVLARPQVWAVTAMHTGLVTLLCGSLIFLLALTGLPLFSGLDYQLSLIIGFALSFSSTVFAVKSLEEQSEMKSLHGRITIGILVMQDLAAVAFLAISLASLPSPWMPALILLIPLRRLFHFLLTRIGHGELLVLYGLVLALGGAELFEMANLKDDLGALFLGILISGHPKSVELFKAMLGFKDLFLVGFFLSIGMSGHISFTTVAIGLLLVPLVMIKSTFFFVLLTRFKLRARTSLLATLNLSSYSEFGLIVIAISVSSGWLSSEWLVIMAVALSVSFAITAPLINIDDLFYSRFQRFWLRFQSGKRLTDDEIIDTRSSTVAIFGMGRVGTGAYDKMRQLHGDTVIGIDFDNDRISMHSKAGRKVIHGDPSDADFWDKVNANHCIRLVMLALPTLQANLDALEQLHRFPFAGRIAAIAKFPDEVKVLQQAGASDVFNIYTEAGAGFADHVNFMINKD